MVLEVSGELRSVECHSVMTMVGIDVGAFGGDVSQLGSAMVDSMGDIGGCDDGSVNDGSIGEGGNLTMTFGTLGRQI